MAGTKKKEKKVKSPKKNPKSPKKKLPHQIKGSQEAKEHMAKLRAMRSKKTHKKKSSKKSPKKKSSKKSPKKKTRSGMSIAARVGGV